MPPRLTQSYQHPPPVISLPPAKRACISPSKPFAKLPTAQKDVAELPKDLGKLIEADVELLQRLGWNDFVQVKRGRGDSGPLNFEHPATRTLKQYKKHGVPVKLSTPAWTPEKIEAKLRRGPHKSCHEYLEFLQEEFIDMINKKQWAILPYQAAKNLPGLRLSPPGVVPQRERRPRWICDYSYYQVNDETIDLFHKESMQFGHALDRILREILLANPAFGPVNLIKIDIADGFYRLDINAGDIPKLGVIFPTLPGQPRLVALPLVLPMGWKNSPPVFCTATETAADLANQRLCNPKNQPNDHSLALEAELLHPFTETSPGDELRPTKVSEVSPPVTRDPSIPTKLTPVSCVDVFMDDFIALGQTKATCSRVRNILMHAIDQVFRPLDDQDDQFRTEPISIKKLHKGDCSWETCKTVLGWIIDTVNMTIRLPEHRVQCLGDILASIPASQKQIGIKKWHKILGELRSMSLALPGARNLFSHMQLALAQRFGQRIALKKGVHQALDDFRYLLDDIANRPTRIAELVPLLASAVGHHDASGLGAGGAWFVPNTVARRLGYKLGPVVWRYEWPQTIKDQLITEENPDGTITNSDLELASGLLHLQALVQYCDARERTVLSKTDNLNALFWQRKEAILSNAPAEAKHGFLRDFRAAEEAVQEGVSSGRAQAAKTAWAQWEKFCLELAIDPLLQTIQNKVPVLQVFGQRLRTGALAPKHNPLRARSVEDYLRHVGQTFLGVGADDPRLNSSKKIDFRIIRMINSWKKKDPPPNRVKPIPIQVIRTIQFVASNSTNLALQRTADMIILAFFFLLRPGEYTASPSNTQPFNLKSVQLFLGGRRLDLVTSSDAQLRCATFASLTFDMQKNGVRGEVIGLGLSGDPVLCPVLTLVRIIISLRNANASQQTPLSSVFINGTWKPVTPNMVSTAIKQGVTLVGPSLGFLASDVSARCLRAAGANALLNARVDPEIITLIGRWRSDEMLRYLHVQNSTIMKNFAARMLNHGDYTLIPNQLVPMQ